MVCFRCIFCQNKTAGAKWMVKARSGAQEKKEKQKDFFSCQTLHALIETAYARGSMLLVI